MCTRSGNCYLINITSKKAIQAHCKAFHCPECGPIKAVKLRKSIYNYVSTWKFIAFWTITIKQHKSFTIETHKKHLKECWRRFLNNLRRNKSLTPEQRNMKFIKVVEEHKNGFIHYHLATDVFIWYVELNNIWRSVIEIVTGIGGKNGNIHCKGFNNPEKVSGYLTKYIVKMARNLAYEMRRYSKSNDITLFPRKITVNNWIYAVFQGQSVDEAINEHYRVLDILVYNKHKFPRDDRNLINNIINDFQSEIWEYTITPEQFESWRAEIYS
jgi:hypothetical protein